MAKKIIYRSNKCIDVAIEERKGRQYASSPYALLYRGKEIQCCKCYEEAMYWLPDFEKSAIRRMNNGC